jgi:hypothetical protein
MNEKKLYSNTNREPMLIALASFKKCTSQLSYRFTKWANHAENHHNKTSTCGLTLSLLAPAFSGRDFYVNPETR